MHNCVVLHGITKHCVLTFAACCYYKQHRYITICSLRNVTAIFNRCQVVVQEMDTAQYGMRVGQISRYVWTCFQRQDATQYEQLCIKFLIVPHNSITVAAHCF